MPHLAPLSWILAPLLFWTTASLLSSMFSFTASPKFSMDQMYKNKTSTNSWSW